MKILFWIFVVLDWFLLVYLPIVGAYGFIRLQIDPDPLNTIRTPFLGIGKFSIRKGVLIWMMQLIMLGAVLMQYATWHLEGESPFIRMW